MVGHGMLNVLVAAFLFSLQGTGFGHGDPLGSLVYVPGGTFVMGDVNGTFTNPHHENDQIPLHPVRIDSFHMGRTEVRSCWCRDFLNAEITAGAYCNWLSRENGYEEIHDLNTWEIDYSKRGIRLPTEAEWEYAGRGGDNDREWAWGMNDNVDGAAGDGVYGALIPAQDEGTTVSYYITATDVDGAATTSPAEGAEAPASLVVGAALELRIVDLQLGADGKLALTWNSNVARTYDVETCTDLLSSNWTVVSSNVTGNTLSPDTTEVVYNITNSPGFFRIRER